MASASNFSASLEKMFHATVLPHILVRTFGYTLPWIEGTVGLLVLLGLLTRYALIGGALVILMLTFGSTLVQDWNAAGQTYALVFPRSWASVIRTFSRSTDCSGPPRIPI